MTDAAFALDDEQDEPPDDAETEAPAQTPLEFLHKILTSTDLITDLDLSKTELAEIARQVVDDLEIDDLSRKDWLETNEKAIKLARQIADEKTFPWPGAANVTYPLVAEAAVQFNARAYPAIVSGKDIVKAKILGSDPQGIKAAKGGRVARHMSYQLLDEMEEWEEDTDRMTMMLPVVGHLYRKVWFDQDLGRNCSELITPDKCVVNDGIKSLKRAPRITQIIELYPYEVQERMMSGFYRKVDLQLDTETDKEAPAIFLEQHRRLDLDDDGYSEPYIVTVHKETLEVVRIDPGFREEDIRVTRKGEIAKITRCEYFVAYRFLPDPNGGFHGMGFGRLLASTNDIINSVINRLLDAGTMSTLGGGFIGSGARLAAKGAVQFKPLEWKYVDVPGQALRDNIFPLPTKEPSPVLYELLGMLVQMGKDLAATKDILTGDNVSSQMPATLGLALIEQGLKVFTAIYKRIHRSLKAELGLLFKLNSIYLNDQSYEQFEDDPQAASKSDYDAMAVDIRPVTDPSEVTDMQRLAKAQFLMQFMNRPDIVGTEALTRVLQAGNIEDIPKLINPNPQPPAEVVKMQADTEHKLSDIKIKSALALAQIAVMRSTAMLNVANAEVALQTVMLDRMQFEFDKLEAYVRVLMDANEPGDTNAGPASAPDSAGGTPSVAGSPDVQKGMALLGAQSGPQQGAMGLG